MDIQFRHARVKIYTIISSNRLEADNPAVHPSERAIKSLGAEMLQDIRDYDTVKQALEQGSEALIPSHIVYAILDGDNPIKVWRGYRGLTQRELAEQVGISIPYLSQLEKGKRKGSLEVLSAIAKALQVSLDDIAPS